MAKKNEAIIVNPFHAIRGLEEYHTRLSGLLTMMDELIQYIEDTPSKNEALKEFWVKNLKKNWAAIQECQNAYINS